MNRIEARNGKLYLMPDNTEISKNTVLGIKYLIREGERLLKQAQKEVEANEKMCDFLRQKAIQGTATANESLAVQDRILAESILKRNRIETEIEDLKFSLEIAEEKAKNERPQKKDDSSEEYEIFSVSKIKAKFDLGNGSVQHVMHTTKDSYDLENANIYNKETGEIVKRGTRIDYNTDFLLKLNRLYILDVKPFLYHHLTNSNNRQKFFDYVKYAALNTEIIKHEGKKTAIQDWVNSVEPSLNAVNKTNTETNQIIVEPTIQSRTTQLIIDLFEQIDKRGWEYAFSDETEYKKFVQLLTDFFEFNNPTLPTSVFKLKARTKTKVAKTLGEIHRELSNSDTLSSDKEYFKIMRVLNHFQFDTETDLYKALTR